MVILTAVMEVMNKVVQRVTVPGVLRVPLNSVCLGSTASTTGRQHVHANQHVG